MLVKLPMYTILTIFIAIGAYLPVLFGQSAFGGWSIIGTLIGGIAGTVFYYKLREAGYIN